MRREIQTNDFVNNSLFIVVPYEFIINITDLSWSELYFGVKCGFIIPDAAIDKAVKLIEQEKEISTTLFDLGSLYKHESSLVEKYLVELVELEPLQDITAIREKWLYLILSWLFNHQEQYNILYAEVPYEIEGVYEKVSVIWDDFERTSILENLFVNKDTINDTSDFILNNDKSDLTDFYQEWENYLNKQEERFKPL
ncbi:DUF2247 family protein [Lysinibacillus xylanilyticus]|uniref:DUF2247 family protein n=1 Tax=Lysinibacillus xylanilyticus TaxID=582475 RepID=UPI0036D91DE2